MYYVWIVCRNRCKDMYLPNQNNWNGEMMLDQSDIGGTEDIRIPIRILDGKCYVSNAEGFVWEERSRKKGEVEIYDQLPLQMSRDSLKISLLFSLSDIRNTIFRKYLIPGNGRVDIGRSPECAICYNGQAISKVHGSIEIRGADRVYTDSSSYGSYVNGVRLQGSYRLRFGDVITLTAGIKIVYLQQILAINNTGMLSHVRLSEAHFRKSGEQPKDGAEAPSLITYHHRMIRIVESPDDSAIEIEPPPNKADRNRQPTWLSLGPSMTMILPMAAGVLATGRSASGLVMIGTSSLLSVFWSLMNNKYRKKEEASAEAHRTDIYTKYIQEIEEEIRSANEKEFSRLMLNNPDVGQCAIFPAENRRRLWERMPSHPDFLYVRLGKGEVDRPGAITTAKQRLMLVDDPLRDEASRLLDTYGMIRNAPKTLNLLEHPMVGILGTENAVAFAKGMVMQLSVLHSYHDVHIAILTEDSQKSDWEWARWIPHVFASEDRLLRMVVSTAASRQDVLSHLDEVLSIRAASIEEKHTSESEDQPSEAVLPHYVVFCTDPALLENKPLLKNTLSYSMGFTVVLLARSVEQLPKECKILLDTDGGNLLATDGTNQKVDYEFPHKELLKSFAKSIAPIRVKASLEDAAIPTIVTFLEVYNVRRVEQLDVWRFWNENKAYEGLKSVIGLSSGSRPFVLDISDKAHGPHGLMAGTTGSGKSVTLETYILSLMLNYHPDQVRFVLIDYKGGGMAKTFEKMPHVTGIIDNLQGERTIARALASLRGEILRREKLFSDTRVEAGYDIKDIHDYCRYAERNPGKEMLPHIIIIVDEFAELKNDQPEFMTELVSASRVGRSLGIHLILTTQKPSNSVSDEIWANTNFRICLRVQSRGDSMDMLHRPDAAYIKGMGRCYVQVGNDEIFEQVQTSYSGASYKPDEPNMNEYPTLLDDAGQGIRISRKKKENKAGKGPDTTEMQAVLDLIMKTVNAHAMGERHMLWLAEMKPEIFFREIPGFTEAAFASGQWRTRQKGLVFPFAMADDVDNQQYITATIDMIAFRNLMIVGLAGTGKTTAVQSMVSAMTSLYDPAHLNIYILSLSTRTLGCLSAFPHVGEIVYEGEIHETYRVLNLLKDEIETRTKLFQTANTDSFTSYNTSQEMSGQDPVPSIVVFIDRMAQIREMLEDDEEMLNTLYEMIREGSSRGIFFVVTSLGGNEVPLKIRDAFQGVALQLRERGDYTDTIGKRVPMEMATIATFPGRGMFAIGDKPYEIQVCLPAEEKTDSVRAQALIKMGQAMSEAWDGVRPRSIARIPEKPTFEEFAETQGYRDAAADPLTLPIAYDLDSGMPLPVNLQQNFSFLVMGPRKSGRTNTLMHIGRVFADRGAEIFIVGGDEWKSYAAETGATLFQGIRGDDWRQFMDGLIANYIAPRNTLRKSAQNKEQLREIVRTNRPFVLLIDNMDQYLDISGVQFEEKDGRLLGQLVSEAANFAMYTFASVASGNIRSRAMQEPLRSLLDQDRGFALGGKLGETDPWNVAMPYRQKNASLPVGTAYLIQGDDYKTVVLPLIVEE